MAASFDRHGGRAGLRRSAEQATLLGGGDAAASWPTPRIELAHALIAARQATAEQRLLREQPPRPRRDQLEAELARGAERLGRLVDDLLNLARREANEPLRAEPVDLTRVSESLVAETRARTPASVSIAHPGEAMVIGRSRCAGPGAPEPAGTTPSAPAGTGGTIRLELAAIAHGRAGHGLRRRPGRARREARDRIFEGFVRLNGSSSAGTGLDRPSPGPLPASITGASPATPATRAASARASRWSCRRRMSAQRCGDGFEQIERVLETVLHPGLQHHVPDLTVPVVDEQRHAGALAVGAERQRA